MIPKGRTSAAGAASAYMPMPRKNTEIRTMTAVPMVLATVASCAIEVGGQHERKGGRGASTNLLPDGVAMAGPGPLRRSKPESCAALGLRLVPGGRHRRADWPVEPGQREPPPGQRAGTTPAEPPIDLARHPSRLLSSRNHLSSPRN